MNIILIFILLLNFSYISADIIWPGLIYAGTYFLPTTIPLIIIGFLFEWFIIKFCTNLSTKQSFSITFFMNLASSLVGIILIPLADVAKDFLLGPIEKKLFGKVLGTFSFPHLLIFFVITVLINSLIETLVFFRRYKQFKESKIFGWIVLANTFSVGIICIYLLTKGLRF